MSALFWILPSVFPALLVVWVVHRTDKEREPPWLVLVTFGLGALLSGVALYLEQRAAAWTGLDLRTDVAGDAGALLFLFALVAPFNEAAKVAATWPAFLSRHFDEPYDGIVYSSAAALGFAAVENAMLLRSAPIGWVSVLRALLALPAHLFFGALWGYALGRAKQSKRPGAIFPAAWVFATACHALYTHLNYGRGSGALVATIPLLLAMGLISVFAANDLRQRGPRLSQAVPSTRGSFVYVSVPPSLRSVREAMRKADQPIVLRWVMYGALVTLGAIFAAVAVAVGVALWAHIDFASVTEEDVMSTGPVAILGAAILAAFPLSGYLIAKASGLRSLLEPALAVGLAIVLLLFFLGVAAPIAVLFALAFSPVAWGLACAGAWVGRVQGAA